MGSLADTRVLGMGGDGRGRNVLQFCISLCCVLCDHSSAWTDTMLMPTGILRSHGTNSRPTSQSQA